MFYTFWRPFIYFLSFAFSIWTLSPPNYRDSAAALPLNTSLSCRPPLPYLNVNQLTAANGFASRNKWKCVCFNCSWRCSPRLSTSLSKKRSHSWHCCWQFALLWHQNWLSINWLDSFLSLFFPSPTKWLIKDSEMSFLLVQYNDDLYSNYWKNISVWKWISCWWPPVCAAWHSNHTPERFLLFPWIFAWYFSLICFGSLNPFHLSLLNALLTCFLLLLLVRLFKTLVTWNFIRNIQIVFGPLWLCTFFYVSDDHFWTLCFYYWTIQCVSVCCQLIYFVSNSRRKKKRERERNLICFMSCLVLI